MDAYRENAWVVFLAVFLLLFTASYVSYRLGALVKNKTPEENRFYMPDFIPSTILGLLVLILGFTFSLTITRFEKRRELVIAEADAIGTAHLRTKLLRSPRKIEIDELMKEYLDQRIEFYKTPQGSARRAEVETALLRLRNQIWEGVIEVTHKDRGAIESIFASSVNSMFDLATDRNVALRKSLPAMIYWTILFISGVGLSAFNFARGERREQGQWQSALLVLMISFVVYLIVDIERPKGGLIQISQEVMTSLRDSWL